MHTVFHGAWARYLPVVGRVLLSLLFINAGWGKIMGFSGTAGYIVSAGLPFPEVLTVLVIIIELGGGLALLLGLHARLAAWALAIFTLLTVVFFHNPLADAGQLGMALKNLAIAGGLLYVAKFGPGVWALWKNSACSCCVNECGCGDSCGCASGTCAPRGTPAL